MTNLPSPPADEKSLLFNNNNNYNNISSSILQQHVLYHENNKQPVLLPPLVSLEEGANNLNVHSPTSPPIVHDQIKDEQQQGYWHTMNLDPNLLPVTLQLESYKDLQDFLLQVGGEDIVSTTTKTTTTTTMTTTQKSEKKYQQQQQQQLVPNNNNNNNTKYQITNNLIQHYYYGDKIPRLSRFHQIDVTNTQFLGVMLDRASKHWCCIGFKIAPIPLDLIRHHTHLPISILYCVAAISLVSDPNHQHQYSTKAKDMAFTLYKKARSQVDDVFFDIDEELNPSVIQSYFCLSYTSNLLRLYDEQRTWGRLAAIALKRQHEQQKSQFKNDPHWLACWYRWYYVDAWMDLTLKRDRLLPDIYMDHTNTIIQQSNHNDHLHHFAMLAHFIRQYLRAFKSNQLTSITSPLYEKITQSLELWYHQLPYNAIQPNPPLFIQQQFNPRVDIHLHLCYHAMRLVLFSRLFEMNEQNLKQEKEDSLLLLIHNTLDTNLQLLQALQHLKNDGCDQSTYHHLFPTIHKVSYSIYQKLTTQLMISNACLFSFKNQQLPPSPQQQQQPQHQLFNKKKLQSIAAEQLLINLELLKSTPAYFNDTFNMRLFATQFMNEIKSLGLLNKEEEEEKNQKVPILLSSSSTSSQPKEQLSETIHPFVSVFRVRDLDQTELRKTTLRIKK
ncbi:hypothetical protein INT45_002979 [Circinella minor]|uniref:Transcription factor domain-containing protein n=1 Tax=Circinella minor TaxID=1195481 RepID=A0A8H7S7W9_9FUNG|nr:hypothetical protein INT45_002979 [Circinella minor]